MKSIGGEMGALNGDLHYLFKLYANRTARWKKGDCLTGFQLRDVSFMSPDPFFKTGSLGDSECGMAPPICSSLPRFYG